MTEQARDSAENLGLDEVPLCFSLLARFGNMVVGADCLPGQLARFGCVADCDSCVIADVINGGRDAAELVLDSASIGLIKTVRTLKSAGSRFLG